MITRALIAFFLLLPIFDAFLSLSDFTPFPPLSTAFAAGKGKAKGHDANGNGNNGNGNANGNGNGGGNGNGNAGVDSGNDKGGESIGDDFRNEGFATRAEPAVTSLPSHDRDVDSGLHDPWPPGQNDKSLGPHGKENWNEYLGLGKKFDLGNLKSLPDGAHDLDISSVSPSPAASSAGDQPGQALGLPKQSPSVASDQPGKALGLLKQNANGADDHPGKALGLAKQQAGEIATKAKKNGNQVEGLALGVASSGALLANDPQQTRDRSAAPQNGLPERDVAPQPGTYNASEVLALNLSTDGSTYLRSLGFEAGRSANLDQGVLTAFGVPNGMDAAGAVSMLRGTLPREQFYLNRYYRPYRPAMAPEPSEGPPSDPHLNKECIDNRCYGRAVIRWTESLAHCASSAAIGVIDTDFDLKHTTFAGQNIRQRSFLPEGKKLAPDWHGTAVLALLAGRPGSSTPGLVPAGQFFAASIFFAGDDGEAVTDTVSLLKAFDWMKASNVRLVNMSFSGPPDELTEMRIRAMRREGVAFTAAAGNEGPAAAPAYPAAYPDVVAVSAVDKNAQIYPSANRGAYIDLAAPGVEVWTAMPGSRAGYRSGTSFATPFATAVLALQPREVLAEPKDALLAHVRTISPGQAARNPVYGRGVLLAPSECPHGAAAAVYQTSTTRAP
jgi:hypothetical protein